MQFLKGTMFAGWISQLDSNALEFMSEVSAPSNYKDLAKIREYEAAARARRDREASGKPITGNLTSVAIVDLQGAVVVHFDGPKSSMGLMGWLGLNYPYLVGFNLKSMIRMAAMTCLHEGLPNLTPFWTDPSFVQDILTVIQGTNEEKDRIPLPQLCRYLGVAMTPTDFNSALGQAQIARNLAIRCNLVDLGSPV